MSLLGSRQRTAAVYARACVHGGWTDINTGTCIYWFSTRLASERGAICQWVGCLIGNQYVCLDSFLLIIVPFFSLFFFLLQRNWFVAKCFYWLFDHFIWISTAGLLAITITCQRELNLVYPLSKYNVRQLLLFILSCEIHLSTDSNSYS